MIEDIARMLSMHKYMSPSKTSVGEVVVKAMTINSPLQLRSIVATTLALALICSA